jgi:hypothetical protein
MPIREANINKYISAICTTGQVERDVPDRAQETENENGDGEVAKVPLRVRYLEKFIQDKDDRNKRRPFDKPKQHRVR